MGIVLFLSGTRSAELCGALLSSGIFTSVKEKQKKKLSKGGLGEGKEVDSKGSVKTVETVFVQHLLIRKNPNSKALGRNGH